MQTIKGNVNTIRFHNQENDWSVITLQNDQGQTVTVTGILPGAGRSLDPSLKEFCEKVYRTSELMGDEIVAGRAWGSAE